MTVQRPKKTATWRAKVHPAFFDIADLNRDFEREHNWIDQECRRAWNAKNATNERRSEIREEFCRRNEELLATLDQRVVDINRRYPDIPSNALADSYLYAPGPQPPDDAQAMFRYLHWMRHRESLDRTLQRQAEGDLTAVDAVARTQKDWLRITHQKGPLKAFKGDTVHRQLLGILIGLEIQPLTAEERADLFDEYCACGKAHDPDALKKQHRRLKRELEAALTAHGRGKLGQNGLK